MKYYSEVLEKFFDDSETLLLQEEAYKKKLEEKKAEETSLVTRKKELAKAVEAAEVKLEEAYKGLDEAKIRCKAILDESNKMMEDILNPATEKVKAAQKARVDAISAFNKEFGAFRTSYTGDRAQREFDRAARLFDDLFNPFFKF